MHINVMWPAKKKISDFSSVVGMQMLKVLHKAMYWLW